jgi:hypothetical protein
MDLFKLCGWSTTAIVATVLTGTVLAFYGIRVKQALSPRSDQGQIVGAGLDTSAPVHPAQDTLTAADRALIDPSAAQLVFDISERPQTSSSITVRPSGRVLYTFLHVNAFCRNGKSPRFRPGFTSCDALRPSVVQ